MLASLGFLTAALLLLLFAYTFDNLIKKGDEDLKPFALAYTLVALAFLIWGLLVLTNAQAALPRSVLIGDGVLLTASICAAYTFMPAKRKNPFAIAAVIAAAALLYLRARYYYPAPVLKDGVLFFNTQRPVEILLSATVILAWLPACMKAAGMITGKGVLRRYYTLYVSTYAITIISAALFIQAKRRAVVIESFVGFSVSILLLLVSNLVAKNAKAVKVAHAAK